MLIDSNSYIGHWPFRKYEYNTLEALESRMKEFGTDISNVSNLNGVFYKNTQNANQELYDALREKKRFSSKFIPWATINPIYGGWKDDFKTVVNKMGMKGIRLYPKYHAYDITNPNCIELVKMSRDAGLPVAFSLQMVDSRTSSWMDIENGWSLKNIVPILKAVPDAKYLIANVGGGTSLTDEELKAYQDADLLLDSSGRFMWEWPDLLTRFGVNKLCFGTHSPILDYFTGLLRIESLRDTEVSSQEKEQIRSGNVKRFMKI